MELNEIKKELEILKQELQRPFVVGKFHKVSLEQFTKDYDNVQAEKIYEDVLILPVRSSEDSAGYDFVITEDIYLKPGESIKIATGIRAEIAKGWVLMIMPRSGLGFKFRLQLNNTIGVIDGDYFYTDNEGHIIAKITNDSNDGKDLVLQAGDRFLQGIFMPYGITEDDMPLGKRIGGMGSSGLKV